MTIRMIPLVVLLLLTGHAGAMPFWGANEAAAFDTPSQSLAQGEFTWAPDAAPAGPILVLVGLDEQRARVYRNGVLIGVATISSGKPGHQTPTGVFVTTFKDKDHHSSIYNNASMPYTQRFTAGGVALHAGGLPGYPSSHGCVHLPSEFARLLFEASPVGMTVVVTDATRVPQAFGQPAFLAPVRPDGRAADAPPLSMGESSRWQPDRSPEGPVSVLISGADKRIVVLRDGIEIGRAQVALGQPDQPFGSHVYQAVAGPADGGEADTLPGRWIGVGLVGHLDDAGTRPDLEAMGRLRIPPDFLQALAPVLAPGSTLMVTDAPILAQTTGVATTVLTSHPDS